MTKESIAYAVEHSQTARTVASESAGRGSSEWLVELLGRVDELTESMLSLMESVGVQRGNAIYVSTPITTGERLLDWLAAQQQSGELVDATREVVRAEVMAENVNRVRPLIEHVRRIYRDEAVIDPTSLSNVPGWTQRDYHAFWCAAIERYVHTVVFEDGWPLSNGCAAEFATAVINSHKLLNSQLQVLDAAEGISLLRDAAKRYQEVGLDPHLLQSAADAVEVHLAR